MSRVAFLALFLAVSLAAPSFAAVVTLDCKLSDLSRGGGWIPDVAVVKVDTASKSVQLLKPTPDQMAGQVKSAKLVRNDAEKMILRWIVKGVKTTRNRSPVTFNYRAVILKSTGKLSVLATPKGYINDFRGKGDCEIR